MTDAKTFDKRAREESINSAHKMIRVRGEPHWHDLRDIGIHMAHWGRADGIAWCVEQLRKAPQFEFEDAADYLEERAKETYEKT